MLKANEYINKEYSELQKPIINKLEIRNNDLERELNLKEFTSLEILQSSHKRLSINTLPSSLLSLDLKNSKLSLDLNAFSHLENLFSLKLEGNEITGSLESLSNLKNLAWLDIDNTKISHGLKYLKNIKLSKLSFGLTNNSSTPFYYKNTIFHPILKTYEFSLPNFFADIAKKAEVLQKGNHYWKNYSHEELTNRIIDIYEEIQHLNSNSAGDSEFIEEERTQFSINNSQKIHKLQRSLWEKVRKKLIEKEKTKLNNENINIKQQIEILPKQNCIVM